MRPDRRCQDPVHHSHPRELSEAPAVSFHGPSSISHVNPSRSLTRVFPVPFPIAGRNCRARSLRSRTVLSCCGISPLIASGAYTRERFEKRVFVEGLGSWGSVRCGRNYFARSAHAVAFYGIRTVSMTWMTPLLAAMSVFTTFASPAFTLPSFTIMGSFLPFTVFALVVATSDAMILPGTT